MAGPLRIVLVLGQVGLLGCAGQCGARGGLPPRLPPLVVGPDGREYHRLDRGPYQAYYDRTGRLDRLDYDQNGDGRPDHIAHHAGRKMPHLIEVDEDFDGRLDRWEDYDTAGRLLKVGRSRRGGRPDVWTYRGLDGDVARYDYDEDGDGRVDRTETLAGGAIVEVALDADRDGRMDRWQEWKDGRLVAERLDTDGDGRADRRLRFAANGTVSGWEAAPGH